MKDLLDFDIIVKPATAATCRCRMTHRKKDVAIEFDVPNAVRASEVPALVSRILKAWLHKYTTNNRKAMSPNQRLFYDALVWFYKNEGRPPSYEEMADLRGNKSKGTPHYYVQKLVELGWVWKDERGRIIPCDIALPEGME